MAADRNNKFQKIKLSNGCKIIQEKRELPPLSVVKVLIPGGSGVEPAGKEGLANLTGRLLSAQTADKDIYEFSQLLEDNGIKVSGGAGTDYLKFTFMAPNEKKEMLLNLMRELFHLPGFSEKALAKLKIQQASQADSRKDSSQASARDRARELIYGNHPYNHHTLGSRKSIEELNQADIKDFYNSFFSLDQLVVSAVGAIEIDELEEVFGSLKLPAVEASYAPPVKSFYTPERKIITRQVDQPTHVLAYPAPSINSEDYVSTKLFSTLLGGGMSSLLFEELREKQSLGYQVGSFYPSYRQQSLFMFYLGGGDPEGEKFREGIKAIVEGISDKGVSEEKLSGVKEYLSGNFQLKHETFADTAAHRGFYEILGRGAEFDEQYPWLVGEVSNDEIMAIADNLIRESEPVFVTVRS